MRLIIPIILLFLFLFRPLAAAEEWPWGCINEQNEWFDTLKEERDRKYIVYVVPHTWLWEVARINPYTISQSRYKKLQLDAIGHYGYQFAYEANAYFGWPDGGRVSEYGEGDERPLPSIQLNKTIFETLKNWRNRYGKPWSVAVYEQDLDIESLQHFFLRMNFADILRDDEAEEQFAVEVEKIEKNGKAVISREWNEIFSHLPNYNKDIFYHSGTLFRQNISEFSGMALDSLWYEIFAWYTSPVYVQGSLPEAFETLISDLLERIHNKAAEIRNGNGTASPRTCLAVSSFDVLMQGELPTRQFVKESQHGFMLYEFLRMLKMRADYNENPVTKWDVPIWKIMEEKRANN